tara:strand:+ start:797 stop:1300 length:504 start_codon:yes stop_codon:yes gene_type:complete
MGFYKVHCKKCQEEWEVMCSFEKLEDLTCGEKDYWGRPMMFDPDNTDRVNTEGCGNPVERIWRPQEAVFAISGKSLDTHGVHNSNGYYSTSFGRYFKNKHTMHEWAEQNGYRSVSQAQADEALDKQYEELKKQDAVGEAWKDNLKKAGGDKIEAAAKTFVSKDMQDK